MERWFIDWKIVSLKPRSGDITSLSESDDKQSDSKSSNSNMKFDKLGLEVRSLRLEEKIWWKLMV